MNFKILVTVWLFLILGATTAQGQQNRTLYLQHDVPQSSFLNPAVPLSCGWTIGLPIISSLHSNTGNNFLSFSQLFNDNGNGVWTSDIYGAEKLLHANNFITNEEHIELLGIGYRKGEWSIMATAIEKNNLFVNVPHDVFSLLLHGNSQFEGQRVSLNRTSAFGSWYTELGLSVAKTSLEGFSWGARGKLLFGKLNVSTPKVKIGLTTDATTYDLALDGKMNIRTSMPAYLEIQNNRPGDVITDESITPMQLFTELGNPGLAFDFGVIKPINEQVQFSASISDLGFIAWRKNIHNYTAAGNFLYTGPFNDSTDTQTYFNDLSNAIYDSLNLSGNENKYITPLPAKLMAGINYDLSEKVSLGATGDVQAYRTKFITGIQVDAAYEPIPDLKGIVSWAYQYNTLRNLGAGLIIGKHPIQFYAFTDNILGFTNVADARNINFRIGLNIMPGCRDKQAEAIKGTGKHKGPLPGTCGWIKDVNPKRKRK
jgi:hypothetical protein